MTVSFKSVAAITIVAGLAATACATRRAPATLTDTLDPMAGQDVSRIYSHGHSVLEVRGQLVCARACAFSEARVVARRYHGSEKYEETKIVVDPDGGFHGELVVSYSGKGGEVKLFPEALVFKVRGCRDAVVPVSDPWPEAVVELECL